MRIEPSSAASRGLAEKFWKNQSSTPCAACAAEPWRPVAPSWGRPALAAAGGIGWTCAPAAWRSTYWCVEPAGSLGLRRPPGPAPAASRRPFLVLHADLLCAACLAAPRALGRFWARSGRRASPQTCSDGAGCGRPAAAAAARGGDRRRGKGELSAEVVWLAARLKREFIYWVRSSPPNATSTGPAPPPLSL